jgi:hypothetical protein
MNKQYQQGEASGCLEEGDTLKALVRHHGGSSLVVCWGL